MKQPFTEALVPLRRWLTGGLLLLAPAALAQPTVTARNPVRNDLNAAGTASVSVTFSQAITAATADNLVVHGNMRRGKRPGTYTPTSGSNATVVFNPAQDFAPGEVLTVIAPSTMRNASNVGVTKHIYQFTAAVGGTGDGLFSGGSTVVLGTLANNGPEQVTTGDFDGDGDLDFLVPHSLENIISVRFNNGSGDFSTGGTTVAVPDRAFEIAVGDIDSDGDLDIVSSHAGKLLTHRNNGSGAFTTIQTLPITGNLRYMTMGDIDGDGDLDVVIGSSNLGNIALNVRLNNGSGTFGGGYDQTVTFQNPMALHDVDSDGDLDLLLCDYSQQAVFVRTNNGSGTFTASSSVATFDNPSRMAVGDVDGDGDLDLVTANGNLPGTSASVRLNNGSGTFSGGQDLTLGTGPEGIALGDIDADGDLDMVVCNNGNGSNAVSVRFNNGSGTFGGSQEVSVGNAPFLLALADVDGDNDLDFLTTNTSASGAGNTVTVRLNYPAPTITGFTPTSGPVGTSVTITGTNLSNVSAVDFNGTAATVFTVNSATSITATVPTGATTGPITVTAPGATATSASSFTVLPRPTITGRSPGRNSRAGGRATNVATTFSQPMSAATNANGVIEVWGSQTGLRSRPGGGTFSGGTTSTLTFDPATDFQPGETVWVTVTTDALSTSSVALAATSVWQYTAAAAPAPATFPAGTSPAVGDGPMQVAVGDWDADGDLDLATVNQNAGTVSIRLNGGSGTYSGAGTVAVGTSPRALAAADVDSDGDLDLLAANGTGNTVTVLLNNGSGTFTAAATVAVGTTPVFLAVGDLDGDGDLDFATANSGSDNVSIRFNDGTGTFSGSTSVSVGNDPRGVALADVNGDGDLDVLTTNRLDNTVSVRQNDGSGAFAGTTSVAVGTDPRGLALADLDGDSDLDLLVSNFATGTVSVRLNAGGTFGGSTDVAVGTNPWGLAIGDLDGDGDLDCAVANSADATVELLLNGGAAALASAGTVAVGTSPRHVALADVDGDLDLDLLATNFTADNVSVRLNQPVAPLPVELLAFTADPQGAAVQLAWRTASEKNSARFEVERSPDGRAFQRLGTVAAQGSSTRLTDYTFLDNQVPKTPSPQDRIYYRLRQVDLDGTASYSPVRSVTGSGHPINGLTLVPNPAHTATLVGAIAGATVEVYDALGRRVLTASADAAGTVQLVLPTGLANGAYVVRSDNRTVRLLVE